MSVVSPQVSVTANTSATNLLWPLPDAKTGLVIVRASGTFGGGTLTFTGTIDGTNFYTLGSLTSAGQTKFNWGGDVNSDIYYTVTGATNPSFYFTYHSATASQ